MDNTLYLRDASKIKQAIIEYASKDTKVYYFPTSLIDNADCEVFLSVWRGNYGDIIKLNVRTYSDIPDYKKQSLSLSFGAPKKTLSLGEACGVPVKSNRKVDVSSDIVFIVKAFFSPTMSLRKSLLKSLPTPIAMILSPLCRRVLAKEIVRVGSLG